MPWSAAPVTGGGQAILEAYAAKYRADHPKIIEGFPSVSEARERDTEFRLNRP